MLHFGQNARFLDIWQRQQLLALKPVVFEIWLHITGSSPWGNNSYVIT